MKYFLLLTEHPYGNETTRSALRTARRLSSDPQAQVGLFLMADAVYCAHTGGEYAEGSYGELEAQRYSAPQFIEILLQRAEVYACGTCMGERDLSLDDMLGGVEKGTMDLLNESLAAADKVLTF